jgi:cellulose biosynthesis protein BcsQ
MVRIKIAILDMDETYVNRLVNAFNTYYQDKLEVYSFTEKEIALPFLNSNKIDVFLADESIEIDVLEIPSRCIFAYMSEMNVDLVNGQKAICKFQKVDLIYKEILALFSEISSYSVNSNGSIDGISTITSFVSFAGGTGASTLAAAYAMQKARKGNSPFYLNIELLGGSGTFFESDGNMNLSDVIYSLKSKKANLTLKIESTVKKSIDGVNYIDTANLALDVMELNKDDVISLIDEIASMQDYDELIVDYNFLLRDVDIEIMRKSENVIVVTDGSFIANSKTFRCLQALQILEQQNDENLTNKMKLFYNKFSSHTGKKLSDINIDVIGGSPKYEGTSKQIMESLATNKDLEKI